MTRLAALLDATAVGLGAAMIAILATGGITIAGRSLERAEDVLVALTVVVAARALIRPFRVPDVRPRRVVVVGSVAYAALMGFIALTRHRALETHALDLGYYVQVVWATAAGYGPRVSLPPMHSWGDHLSPVLLPFAAVAMVRPGAAPLLVAQTLILGAGAFAVFAFARRHVGDRAAAMFVVLYLMNPSLHGINIRDVHPQAFAIPLLIAAALAFDTGHHAWCAVALVATLACREDAALAVVGFGIWLAIARRRVVAGAAVAAVALALLAVDIRVIMPYFRGAPYPHLHRWAYLGSSPTDMLVSLVFRPWRWIAVAVTAPKLVYLAALLAPLAFLPLAAPALLLAAVPGLAINLLSLDPVLFHYRTQYQSFVLPFFVLAAVEGYRNVRPKLAGARWITGRAALAFGLAASVVLTARTVNDFTVTRWRLGPDQRAAYRLIARVPAGAPVSTSERVVPHLATRREVYVFPQGLPESEYVLERQSAAPLVPASYDVLARDEAWVLWTRTGTDGRRAGVDGEPPSPDARTRRPR